jgi:hypothetical protein
MCPVKTTGQTGASNSRQQYDGEQVSGKLLHQRVGTTVIVRTLEYFRKYLYRQEFHLRTGHSALTRLMSFKKLEGQTARWIPRLQEYIFTSEHRQG